MKKFTYISFNPSGDSYDVIFLEEQQLFSGDYYHDKIRDQFEGIKTYVTAIGEEYIIENINLNPKNSDKEYSDYYYQPNADETLSKYLKRIMKCFKKINN